MVHSLEPLKLILSLTDPEYPEDIGIHGLASKKCSLKSAIRLAKNNGLHYCFLTKLRESNIGPSFLKEDLARERQKLEELKKTIVLLNNTSKDRGIDYILIKACTTLPHVPRDVDILVHSEDKRRARQALESVCMKCIHSNEVETSLNKKGYMKIDIYTRINYSTVNFISDAFLWRSRIEDEIFGVKYPSLNNEANFLLMLIHSLFGHREMTLLDFLHMKSLMPSVNMDICRKHAHEKGWEATFDLALKKFESLSKGIYEEGEVIQFPYLFSRGFILGCISMVEGLEMKGSAKLFLNLSFLLDKVFYYLKKSPLYEYGSSNFKLARKVLNSFGYFIRSRSGDRESM